MDDCIVETAQVLEIENTFVLKIEKKILFTVIKRVTNLLGHISNKR